MRHELSFKECSLFNSEHEYRRGYDRAVCSCGWTSTPSKEHVALVTLWSIHKKDHRKSSGGKDEV